MILMESSDWVSTREASFCELCDRLATRNAL
jgi:hypothetical protein